MANNSKASRIFYWVATAWLSLGMISTAIVQLLKIKEGTGGVNSMLHLGYPVYVLSLLGIWKILGVIAILIPKQPLLKEWAYAGFIFLTTGAVYSHIAAGEGFNGIFGAALLLLLTGISWYFRPAERKIISVNFSQ